MNISRPGTILIAMALFAAPIMLLSSCSDSEKRLPVNDSMAKVLLNVGGSAQAPDGRMAASAPPDITAVSVTVTGPGMIPINRTDTSTTGIIDLDVPAGPARLFAVTVATASGGLYSGTAVASLPAGVTVSVPVVMEPGGLFGPSNEGSIENPVYIGLDEHDEGVHMGSVGRGRSYYFVNAGSHEFLNISMFGLTDDADLISYGAEMTFDEADRMPPDFMINYCGRTKDEFLNRGGYPGTQFFVVDGSHTKSGARYILKCKAHSGMITGPLPVAEMELPLYVEIGLPYDTRIGFNSLLATNANFYTSDVRQGTQYWINTYPYEPLNVITVYMGPLFTNPLTPGISIFTAGTSGVCYSVTNNSFENSFTLEVVAHEGTPVNPIVLYPNEDFDFDVARANFCMVGGAYGSSYYKFPVTQPKPAHINNYIVSVTQILGDVDLYVYNGPSFEEFDQIGTSTLSGQADENFTTLNTEVFPDGYMYVEVRDAVTGSGTGSTFVLDVNRNGF